MQRKLTYLLFLIVPAVILATSVQTIQRRGFNWFGGGYDPVYCYLLNSVNNAGLIPAGHIDHPGTTAQVYGAVVLRIYNLFDCSKPASLRMAVLKDPERHLFILTYAFLALNVLFLVFSGIVAFKATSNLWLALLLQAAPFFSTVALFDGLTHASQESMLLLSALMMLTLVSWQFLPGLNRSSRQNILLFALVTGFGMTSKVTFLPLVILPLILIPGLKNKLWYMLISIGAFVLFTFPIWTEYGHMMGWIWQLIIHTGNYGSGSVGVIDSKTFFSNFSSLLTSNTLFFVIVTLSLLLILLITVLTGLRKSWNQSPELKILLAVTIVELAGLMLVAKMPNNHYMLPYESLLVLNIFCMLFLLWKSAGKAFSTFVLPAVITIIIIFVSDSSIKAKNLLYTTIPNHEYLETTRLIGTYNASYARIYCLPCSSIPGSLFFGNVYARREYLGDLEHMYPNSFFYEAPGRKLMTWDAETTSFANIISTFGDHIVIMNMLRGFPFTLGDISYLKEQGLELKDIYKGQYQTLYEVDTVVTGSDVTIRFAKEEIFCDAETTTADNRYYLSNDGHRFETDAPRTDEKAHSGRFSAKLTPAYPFAMTIKLDSIAPGDIIEVSAWRWGGNNDGLLVASGPDAETFYAQQNTLLMNGPGGWNKVLLSFILPPTMAGKQLKIYAWNSGQSAIYFDDLQIIIKHS